MISAAFSAHLLHNRSNVHSGCVADDGGALILRQIKKKKGVPGLLDWWRWNSLRGSCSCQGHLAYLETTSSYFLRYKWMFVSVREPEFWYAGLILVNLSLSPSVFSLFLSPVSGAEFVLLARASDEQHRCQAPPRLPPNVSFSQ